MRNWSPGASWYDEACSFAWDWHDWETFTTHWCEFAWHNALRKPKSRDEVLLEMLKQHRHASILEKRVLNKLIWRRRRSLKRLKHKQEVRMAVGKGAFPRSAPKHISINWAKLSNGRDPADVMREYYCRLYALDEAAEVTELTCKQHWIETWRLLCTGLQSYQVTVARLRAAIKKLRNSKGSPDGCVAEMYKHLPDAALEGLAEYFTALLTAVSSPDAWTVVCATLIPKVVGACSLDKFRAIACLPVARKLLGYIWLQMLPALRYHTLQCGFVPKSQAANGVYILKRTAERSKEWKKPLFLAQLDLTKAFDRELHSAVVKALRLQGVSLQCLAIICNVFLKSKAATTLGHVTAEVVDMLRGLPQGAPESPLTFTLVTEMVLRPLMQKWQSSGMGWLFDGLFLSCVCYADDIILVASSKKDLEKMLADVLLAFQEVGLEVSFPKCRTAKGHAEAEWRKAGLGRVTYVCWHSSRPQRQ